MDFKTLLIIKHPLEPAWVAMRDHLSEIAALVEEIESVETQQRIERSSGIVELINNWKANPQLHQAITHYTKPEWFTWTDTAIWDDSVKTCQWTLQPLAFPEQIEITGVTCLESALGGNGTRVTIQGQLSFQPSLLGQIGKFASFGLEPLFKQVITNNFNRLSKALGDYLNKHSST